MRVGLLPSKFALVYEALDFRPVPMRGLKNILCHWLYFLRGEPFERAEVTKTVNLVSLLPQATRAVPGDVIKGDSALKTGGDSRAELQFPDLTIARVGSNALFRFIAGARDITLDGGTMLFSSPKGAGGGTVQAGAITAAVTGSDFLISNIGGRVKVICLSHKVLVYLRRIPRSALCYAQDRWLISRAGLRKCRPSRQSILRCFSRLRCSAMLAAWDRSQIKRSSCATKRVS